MRSFLENSKAVRLMSSVSGGTNTQTSAILDTAGFDSATVISMFGGITAGATATMTITQSDNTSSGFATLTGAEASLGGDDDEKMLAIEIYRPTKRYLKAVITILAQNAEVDGVLGILRDPQLIPFAAQHTSVADYAFTASPDETT
jgi:hypothetical protein